jgi:hypothetical protein
MSTQTRAAGRVALPRQEGPYAARDCVGTLLWYGFAGGMASLWLWVTGRPYLVIPVVVVAVLLVASSVGPEAVIEDDALVYRNGRFAKWRRIPFAEIRAIRWDEGLKGHILQVTHGPEARSAGISAISADGKRLRWPTSHNREWPEQPLFNALRETSGLELTNATEVTEGEAAERLRLWALCTIIPLIGFVPLAFDIDTAWTFPLTILLTAPAQISARIVGFDVVFRNAFSKQKIVRLDDICGLRFAPLFGRFEKLRVLHISTRSRARPLVVLAISQERPTAPAGPILSQILQKTGLPIE